MVVEVVAFLVQELPMPYKYARSKTHYNNEQLTPRPHTMLLICIIQRWKYEARINLQYLLALSFPSRKGTQQPNVICEVECA